MTSMISYFTSCEVHFQRKLRLDWLTWYATVTNLFPKRFIFMTVSHVDVFSFERQVGGIL